MDIKGIFENLPYEALRRADANLEVHAIEFSSRDVELGALFFCVKGTNVDGHDFALDAVNRGAVALVVERELDIDIPQFLVQDSRSALALCSANFYGKPSEHLDVVGITGTNGKTTTAFLVEHLIKSAGRKAGLMGTVECHVGDEVRQSLHTTPESRDFQALLADMVAAGVDACACEISSHALDLDRVLGTSFAVAAFTNLTQDHLDYHETMESYFEAKAKLFCEYEPRTCVICVDSEPGMKLAALCANTGRACIRVGSDKECEVHLIEAEFESHSTTVTLNAGDQDIRFTYPLVGRFNVENMLVAFGVGRALGFDVSTIVAALESAPQIPGRLERVTAPDGSVAPFGVLVDYAHTPDSVAKAISAVRAITTGRVICVFGCGGDRDASKRPKMGAAALAADLAIVTSDNPRTEDPKDIIEQILPGMEGDEDRYRVIQDRTQAIYAAIAEAKAQDVVLIAGKGHEDYQIIGTVKHHFDDREVAAAALEGQEH